MKSDRGIVNFNVALSISTHNLAYIRVKNLNRAKLVLAEKTYPIIIYNINFITHPVILCR